MDFSNYTTFASLTNEIKKSCVVGIFMYSINGQNISKINLLDGTVNQTWCSLTISNIPGGMASDGTYLYVADFPNATVAKIELSTGTVTANWLTTIERPGGMDILGNYLYLTDVNQCTLNKINLSDGSIIKKTKVIGGGDPYEALYNLTIYKNYIYVLSSSIDFRNNNFTIMKYNLDFLLISTICTISESVLVPTSLCIIGNYIYTVSKYGKVFQINRKNGIFDTYTLPYAQSYVLLIYNNRLWSSNNTSIIYYNSGPVPLVSNICFLKGTPILTDQGLIEIQNITNQNTINGICVDYITQTTTEQDYLVCIEKDLLGENIPSQRTVITRNHRLMYNGQLIEAGKLQNIIRLKYNSDILYNVLLKENGFMNVNNLICETLDINNAIAHLYRLKKINDERIKELNTIKEKSMYKKKILEILTN